jgi:hypothetical protein
LLKIQEHFLGLVVEESRGMFKPDEMRVVDLTVLREVKKVFMSVPGMYGVSTVIVSCRMEHWLRLFFRGSVRGLKVIISS